MRLIFAGWYIHACRLGSSGVFSGILWTLLIGVSGHCFLVQTFRILQIPGWQHCQQRVTIPVRTPACNPHLEWYRPCLPGYLLIWCEDTPHDTPVWSWKGKAYPVFSIYVSKIDTQAMPFKFRIYITIRWVTCRQWNLVLYRRYSGENPKGNPVTVFQKNQLAIP